MNTPRLVLPLRVWLAISHLIVLTLPLVAPLATGTMARELEMQAKGHLIHQGAAIARLVAPEMEPPPDRLTAAIAAIEADTDTRVWLLDDAGTVVVASRPADLGRPMAELGEVSRALRGQQTGQLRGGPEGEIVRMVVGTPIVHEGRVVGVVLESRAPMEVLRALWFMSPRLSWGIGLALVVTITLGLASAHVLSRSLRRASRASRRIADGRFDAVAELGRPGRSHVVEVGELSRDMATMAGRLQERLAYITEFAGNVSHEFKTPITTLRGTVELLRDDEQMPAEQRARFLDNALADLARMERLVSGLLALARAEQASDAAPVDLDLVVAAVAERHPELSVSGQGGTVTGARSQLEAVVENLVDNAYRHGGAGVRVEIRAWRRHGAAGFDVIDDGAGISAANLPRVFDRFFTTSRAQGGAGLGLALVRAIVRAHGGDVLAESRPGHTCFRVSLPLR